MASSNRLYLALASTCLLLCNVAVAQVSSTTEADPLTTPEAPVLPVDCASAKPAALNSTLLLGTWYQAARKPVGFGNNEKQCYQVIAENEAGNVTLQLTYSTDVENLGNNQTKSISVDVGLENSEIMVPVFYFTVDGEKYTYKVLESDYESYAYVCVYLSADDSSSTTTTVTEASSTTDLTLTSIVTNAPSSTNSPADTTPAPVVVIPAGAIILTRETEVSSPRLLELTENAVASFTDFKNLFHVDQSEQCRSNGSATTVPALAMIMVAFYSLLKISH